MGNELNVIARSVGALLRAIWRDRRPIVGTHLAYTIMGFAVLFPAIGLFARVTLALSGKTALTNLDILFFALTPTGAIGLVLLGAFLIFVIAFEQAALATIAVGANSGLPVSAAMAIRYSLKHATRILGFAWRLVLKILLLALPFIIAAAGVFLSLLTEHDINFYLQTKPPEFWTALVLMIVIFAGLAIVLVKKLLDWSMVLPLLLFGGERPSSCFKESAAAMRGNRRKLLPRLAAWAGAALILTTIMGIIMWLAANLLVPVDIDSTSWLVLALGTVVAIGAVGGFVVAAFTAGSFAYVIVDAYYAVLPHAAESTTHALPIQETTKKTVRLTTRRAVLTIIAGVVIAGLTGYWLVSGIVINEDVYVIAHRGASGRAPENTIAAIQAALEDEADWIEIDVQETVEGEIVLLHDSDFMKLAGVDLKVSDGTLEQVRAVDVGSWYGAEFADQRVPTLAEALQLVHGRGRLIIELKYYGHDDKLEERVAELVEQADMVDDVMIMSLNRGGVRKMRNLRPDWTIGLLAAQAAGNLAQLDVDFLAVKSSLVTPDFVLAANNSGKEVFVWTLNDAYSMTRAISLGVDGIITNEPVLARQVMTDRANLTPAEYLFLHTSLLLGWQPPARTYRDDSP